MFLIGSTSLISSFLQFILLNNSFSQVLFVSSLIYFFVRCCTLGIHTRSHFFLYVLACTMSRIFKSVLFLLPSIALFSTINCSLISFSVCLLKVLMFLSISLIAVFNKSLTVSVSLVWLSIPFSICVLSPDFSIFCHTIFFIVSSMKVVPTPIVLIFTCIVLIAFISPSFLAASQIF